MTPIAAGVGVQLDYRDDGDGRSILAIHGIGGSGDLLAGELAPLTKHGRLITYERRGYGASEAPEPYLATTVTEQSEDAAALLAAIDAAPTLLVGVGFGALIALDLCLRHAALVCCAVLVDPPLYSLDLESTRELADQRGAIETALLAGSREGAVAALLGAVATADLLTNAQANSAACFADYGGLASLELTHAQLRNCDLPIRIISTSTASQGLTRIAGELNEMLGNSALLAGGDPAAAAEALLD